MKRKKGRPPGRKFPQPDNLSKAIWNAGYGKLGLSSAMHIAKKCPHRQLRRIEEVPPEHLSPRGKRSLERRRRDVKEWNSKIGQVVGEKIVAGNHTFFHELADAVEILADKNHECHSRRRLLALYYKLECDAFEKSFTLKGLRDHYKRHKHRIDSSTLSKMYQWTSSAALRRLPVIPS